MNRQAILSSLSVEKIYHFFLLLLCASIPLAIRLNSLLMVATFGLAAFHFFYTGKKLSNNTKYLWIFVVLYIIHFIGFANSEEFKPVNFDLEQKLPLLAIPLMIAIGPEITARHLFNNLCAFVCVLVIVCLLSFRNGFFIAYYDDALFDSLLVHRPYLGMYCVFAIFVCIEFFRSAQSAKIKGLSVLLVLFFILFLFVLLAKMAILGLFILGLIYLAVRLYKSRKFALLTIFLATGFIVLCYFTLINERGRDITHRLTTFSFFEWSDYDATIVNSANLRFIKWSCTAKVLADDHNWLFGAGTGDAKKMLTACYAERLGEDSFFVQRAYNSHNSYLTVWLHLGLLPLLFFVFHFLIILYKQFKLTTLIPLFFTLCIMTLSMSESIFEVQKGVVFYAFFQSLFLFAKEPNIKPTL